MSNLAFGPGRMESGATWTRMVGFQNGSLPEGDVFTVDIQSRRWGQHQL